MSSACRFLPDGKIAGSAGWGPARGKLDIVLIELVGR